MRRRILLGLAVVGGLFALTPSAEAQSFTQGFNDPFFQYYGFYLPRQAALAAQPTTPQMLNDVAVARQNIVQQDRSGLYNPGVSPYMSDSYDPMNPFSRQGGEQRLPRLSGQLIGGRSSSIPAPDLFYNRTSSYYPTFRSGNSANRTMVGQRNGLSRAGAGMGGMNAMSNMGGMMGMGGFGGMN